MSDLENRVEKVESHITQLTIQTERIATSVEQLAKVMPQITQLSRNQHELEIRIVNNENALAMVKYIAGAFVLSGSALMLAYIFGQ